MASKYFIDQAVWNEDIIHRIPHRIGNDSIKQLNEYERKVLKKIHHALPVPEITEKQLERQLKNSMIEFVQSINAMLTDEEILHTSICKWIQGLFGTESSIRRAFLREINNIDWELPLADICNKLDHVLLTYGRMPKDIRQRYEGIIQEISDFLHSGGELVQGFYSRA